MLAGLTTPAGAQAVGSEFQVNTYTTANQRQLFSSSHVVAADASGNSLVVWESLGQDGSDYGIFGQRYDSSGEALGSEFRVNSFTTNGQRSAAVAAAANGDFVVVWQSLGQDGSDDGIFGQRYDGAGGALGSEFRVNSFTTNTQRLASVAAAAAGDFVVVWESVAQDGSAYGVFGQRYDSAGSTLGDEFRVNSFTTGPQGSPSVASDADGNFVVVWGGFGQGDYAFGIHGQRFDSAGNALGNEFLVNTYTSSVQARPFVDSDAEGNFVVVWDALHDQDGDSYGVFGQRYDSGGVPQGDEFRANSFTSSIQALSSVASDASGNFVVVWDSNGQDGSLVGVFGQRYDRGGVARGEEFRINSYTTDDQRGPAAVATGTNQFVVVWDSRGQDGSSAGVFGQRFDFGPPTLSISDVSVTEGNLPGRVTGVIAAFTVTLSSASAQAVAVDYATADGTAAAPPDYRAKTGTLTFSPGQTSRRIAVVVKEDNAHENDETFFVNLGNPTNATIADGQGVGTILNDDP